MKHNLQKSQFPKDSRNEQLEFISNIHFCPLFDERKFILKPELIDNGIDFKIELKENGNKIGFGLNFQLKSTENIAKNKDGSYSKSIETSNIEYLLNNGQSAYYAFYVVSESTFFYADLYDVLNLLNKKDENWQNQQHHTIRFFKKLTPESLNEIYKTAYERGLMLRKVHSTLAENLHNIESNEKIVIDYQGQFTTDAEIEEFIEKYGWFLNDECRWNEMISIHNKGSVGASKSALYSFFIGMAYSYTGEYFKALDHIGQSFGKIKELDEYLKDYVIYAYYELQYLFKLISLEEYNSGISSISKSSSIRNHIELEEIENLISSLYSSSDFTSKQYEEKILEFLDRDDVDEKIKFQAKIGFAEYRGQQFICSAPIIFMYSPEEISSRFVFVNKEFKELLQEVQKKDSFFLAHICTLKHNKFLIEFQAVCMPHTENVLGNDILKDVEQSLKLSYQYFKKIGHIYNQIYSLTVLLEYYELTEDNIKKDEIAATLNSYAERYGNPELKKKIDFILSGGTFVKFMHEEALKTKRTNEEIQQMREELIKLDKKEKAEKRSSDDCNLIHVFPMGHFLIPRNKTKKCFKILKVNKKAEERLEWFFNNGIIPVVNSYTIEIISEGYGKGNLEYKGIDSYRNMYRIRKAFFENDFYRTNLNLS